MNAHLDLFLSWLWRASWQAALLAIAVMAAQRLLGRRTSLRWRSALWAVVILRLLMPDLVMPAWMNSAPAQPAARRPAPGMPQKQLPQAGFLPPLIAPAHLPPVIADATPTALSLPMGDEPKRVELAQPTEKPATPPLATPSLAWPPLREGARIALNAAPAPQRLPAEAVDQTVASSSDSPVARSEIPLASIEPPHEPEAPGFIRRAVEWAHSAAWPTVKPLAALLWLLCAAAGLARLFIATFRMRQRIRSMRPVTDAGALALLESVRQETGTRRRVRMLCGAQWPSPALVGLWRPAVALPEQVLHDLDARQLRLVLMHELAHLQRGDLLMNWVCGLLAAAHWFNPLLTRAFARMQRDREAAADERVMEWTSAAERPAYGRTLIRLLEMFSRPAAAPGVVGMLGSNHPLRWRIQMIANFRQKKRKWSNLPMGSTLLVAGLAAAAMAAAPAAENDLNRHDDAPLVIGADADQAPSALPRAENKGAPSALPGSHAAANPAPPKPGAGLPPGAQNQVDGLIKLDFKGVQLGAVLETLSQRAHGKLCVDLAGLDRLKVRRTQRVNLTSEKPVQLGDAMMSLATALKLPVTLKWKGDILIIGDEKSELPAGEGHAGAGVPDAVPPIAGNNIGAPDAAPPAAGDRAGAPDLAPPPAADGRTAPGATPPAVDPVVDTGAVDPHVSGPRAVDPVGPRRPPLKPAPVRPDGAPAPQADPAHRVAFPELANVSAQMAESMMRPVEAAFIKLPLSDVVGQLSESTNENLMVDWKELESAGVEKSTPITIQLKRPLPLIQVLKLVAHEAGKNVTIDVSEGLIWITASADAPKTVLRAYDVTDLIDMDVAAAGAAPQAPEVAPRGSTAGIGSAKGAFGASAGPDARAARDVSEGRLISLIRETVSPETWRENGGLGSINSYGDRFVIVQTPVIHQEIESLLQVLRDKADHKSKPSADDLRPPPRQAPQTVEQPKPALRPTPSEKP